jgi:hypothetical protein
MLLFTNIGNLKLFSFIEIKSLLSSEELSTKVERMVFVLKSARSSIPATKMVIILKGFCFDIPLTLMRHLYASYGWAQGTKKYDKVDFRALNLKVVQLKQLCNRFISRKYFVDKKDQLQSQIEIFRTLGTRGITRRFPGSRVTFELYKKNFLTLGLLGLVECARPQFRNSKLGFREEGWII